MTQKRYGKASAADPIKGGTLTREEYLAAMEGRDRPLTDSPMRRRAEGAMAPSVGSRGSVIDEYLGSENLRERFTR